MSTESHGAAIRRVAANLDRIIDIGWQAMELFDGDLNIRQVRAVLNATADDLDREDKATESTGEQS